MYDTCINRIHPMIQSEAFGRTFWLDADDNFKSAPTLVNGGADYDARDYVSDWEDWDGVNVDLLLAIYRQLLTTKITKFFEDKMQSIIVLLQLEKNQPEIQLANWHTMSPIGVIFVYYKNMKFKDQFTIVLDSRQHELMLEIFSGAAGLDLPPTCEPEFNSLWESVIECHHEIVEEDS